MLTLTNRQQLATGLGLIALMAVTRGNHFATSIHLPEASLAIFFLAGVYVRQFWLFAALLFESVLLDFTAVTIGGISDYCISPAYGFLLPAYGVLWMAGRWYASQHQFQFKTLLPLGASLFAGAFLSELLSSGGFYFFSGNFADTNLMTLGARLLQYFPSSLQALFFYMSIAVALHLVFAFAANDSRTTATNLHGK